MEAVIPLSQMSTAEKLQAMEVLWEDLTRHAEAFESPAWHGEVLSERSQRVAEGKESYIPWEQAKQELTTEKLSTILRECPVKGWAVLRD